MGGGTTRTVVLVGRVGNGKSATGNSILRMKAFASSYSFASVTRICQMQTTVLEDGSTLNVIDTPGMLLHLFSYIMSCSKRKGRFLGE